MLMVLIFYLQSILIPNTGLCHSLHECVLKVNREYIYNAWKYIVIACVHVVDYLGVAIVLLFFEINNSANVKVIQQLLCFFAWDTVSYFLWYRFVTSFLLGHQ